MCHPGAEVTDMHYGYHRVMQIVNHKFHREAYSGVVFLIMSKERRSVFKAFLRSSLWGLCSDAACATHY